jgi:hypothetical protein
MLHLAIRYLVDFFFFGIIIVGCLDDEKEMPCVPVCLRVVQLYAHSPATAFSIP